MQLNHVGVARHFLACHIIEQLDQAGTPLSEPEERRLKDEAASGKLDSDPRMDGPDGFLAKAIAWCEERSSGFHGSRWPKDEQIDGAGRG